MQKHPLILMLLGSGELGKEVTIAAKRIGCTVIACDRYSNAPAMQVADIAEVFNMSDPIALKKIVKKHSPNIVIPEIEALAVNALEEIEKEGTTVIPNARATAFTMNRDKIRDLASKQLNLKTAQFEYASNLQELQTATDKIGLPVIIKPIMSSSGKGQSLVKKMEDLEMAWEAAMKDARGSSTRVIVEEFLTFDLEITLLTIRQKDGSTIFCPPIGHEQSEGDYQCSWQPANLNPSLLQKAEVIAKRITTNLGGAGLFGVEFFISNQDIIFSELSPRPHDTGLVTMISQNLNEFELHLRAILGLPIPEILSISPAASKVILSDKDYSSIAYSGIDKALVEKNTEILLFGKPNAKKGRRLGVALATGDTIKQALTKANHSAACIQMEEG